MILRPGSRGVRRGARRPRRAPASRAVCGVALPRPQRAADLLLCRPVPRRRGCTQAIRNSLVQQRRAEVNVPPAPVFHPTLEEFRDPLAYISRIRAAAEPYGIAKVVPPAGAARSCRHRSQFCV